MRPFTILFFAVVLAFTSLASAAEVQLVRVWPDYRTNESFVRVGEYFGGQESTPELLLRSQSGVREGYYFLIRFKSSEAVPGAILAVETILPGSEVANVHFFSLDLPRGSRAILAGLTGADWPDAKVQPTAWRVRLLSAGGTELARQQSFLWALPPASAAPAGTESPAEAAPATLPAPASPASPDAPATVPAGT
jgi:hypothetical protein